ncbi:MAG: HlyD family efflux transporter periplasmic adaptor subunit [Planctomycetales bacterium]|nr:HlyD family efflux transporter periplasmic adaptor subunit [Planctomycetales bacterium]
MPIVVEETRADAGVVWRPVSATQWAAVVDVGLDQTLLPESAEAIEDNNRRLVACFESGEASLGLDASETDSPLGRYWVVVCPLFIQRQPAGCLQLFFDRTADKEPELALELAEHAAGLASLELERSTRAPDSGAISSATPTRESIGELSLKLHRSLSLELTCAVGANDGRLFLDADRVSVFVSRGKSTRALAISGQEKVNQHAVLVRKLTAVARLVADRKSPMTYLGASEALDAEAQEVVAELIDESGLRNLVAIPLLAEDEVTLDESSLRRRRRSGSSPALVGVLLAEWSGDARRPTHQLANLETLGQHLASSIHGSLHFRRVLLLETRYRIGLAWEWFHGRRLQLAALILTAVIGVLLALVLVPWTYRVKADGRVLPATRANVFAPADGYLRSANLSVASNQRVHQGDVLLRLESDSLEQELHRVDGERAELESRALALQAQIHATVLDREANQLRLDLAQTQSQLQSVETSLGLLRKQLDDLTITAPIDGVVITFQVEKWLTDRPVNRGELLLEIMDDSGPWHLEVRVPAKRIEHVETMRDQLGESSPLTAEFFLVAAPEQVLEGPVSRISSRVESTGQEGPTIEMIVELNGIEFARPKIGAEARCRIPCGKQPLGYVLFGDVVDYLRTRLWF